VTTFPRRDSVRGNRGLTPVFFLYRDGGDYRGAVSPNEYSRRWHETFSKDRDGSVDVSFLAQWLPPGRVLDVCCGFGRHKRGLEERGWEVVGVERDPDVAAAAGALGLDMRELSRIHGMFDAVICMWASFGYFSSAGHPNARAGVVETTRVERDRLFVHLGYTDGQTDELEWELFTPSEIREAVGLTCVYEDASPDAPRMIHVFER
jgi:hypothetical protein